MIDTGNVTVKDCGYHRQIGDMDWCDLSDNPCFVGILDGNECDEFNELKEEWEE